MEGHVPNRDVSLNLFGKISNKKIQAEFFRKGIINRLTAKFIKMKFKQPQYLVEDANGNPLKANTPKEIFELITSNNSFIVSTDRIGDSELQRYLDKRIHTWFFPNRYGRCSDSDAVVITIGDIGKAVLNRHLKNVNDARKKRLADEKSKFPSLECFEPNHTFYIRMHFETVDTSGDCEWVYSADISVEGIDNALKVYSLSQKIREKLKKNPCVIVDLELRFDESPEHAVSGEGDYILQWDGMEPPTGYGSHLFWEHSRIETAKRIKNVIKPLLVRVGTKAKNDVEIIESVFDKEAVNVNRFYQDAIDGYKETIEYAADKAIKWEEKHQLATSGNLLRN